MATHQPSGSSIDDATQAAGETTIAGIARDQTGTIIAGRYKLIERIGEGGMGSVWLAYQSEPVKRNVAVKLIKLGMDSRQVLNRFEAERQALAMMDHPNIAKVLDGGLTPDGRPFFVMELVKGTPITDFCDAHKLNMTQRLELFVPVCQAIQHAHQKGIIHRDIKPSNVMVAAYDDRPVPKVIDFGVAKATGQSLTEATIDTGFGGVIGTPQYMSPEQATLDNLDIDTRSDVYSLGVLLYELLTGEPPFSKAELQKKGLMEVLRVVREDDPPKPSTKLSTADALPTLSANRNIEPRKLTQMLRNELDWIVLKALEKNRIRRYDTANALAADVQRYLSGEPVLAHPPSAAYQMKKLIGRYRPQVVAASLVLLALIAGISGTTYGLIRANESARAERFAKQQADQRRLEAEQQKTRAEAGEALAKDRLAQVAAERDAKEMARKEAETQKVRAEAGEKLAQKRLVEVAAERDAKEKARLNAEAIANFLGDVFQSPDPTRDGRTIKVAELLDKAAQKLEADLANQPGRKARLQSTLARTYYALGLSRQAVPLQEKARDYQVTTSGAASHEALVENSALAAYYRTAGRLAEAVKLAEGVLAQTQKTSGSEDPPTLHAMAELATIYADAGRRDKALEMRIKVFKLEQKVLGPDNPSTLMSMSNLAHSYFDAGRLDEALKLQEELLPLWRKTLGAEHPNTLMATANLAGTYTSLGRLDEALKLHEQVLTLRQKVLGPEHPDTLIAMNNLATSQFQAGHPDDAIAVQEQVLALSRKTKGPDHLETLAVMSNLAYFYDMAGRSIKALKLREELLPLAHKALGNEHPLTLVSMGNLAISYDSAGRRAESMKLMEEVLPLRRKVLGPDHPETLTSMNDLGLSLLDAGELDKAEKMLRDCLAIRKKKLPNEWHTFNTQSQLGAVLLAAGKNAEAEKLLLDGFNGMKQREKTIPVEQLAHLKEAAERLSRFYDETGKGEEAKKWKAEGAKYGQPGK